MHGRDLLREQDTPDDPMQAMDSYMISRRHLASFFSSLFLHSTSTTLPQLIITLFYCPTGLAAYILL